MFNQISLFIILLTPVMAYVSGAVLYSVVACLRKDLIATKYHSIANYRNGL